MQVTGEPPTGTTRAMRDAWIIASKLAPPVRPQGWIARQLLPEGAPLPPVVTLVGGPGTGKTLAMLALTARLGDVPLVWYGLDETDREPATFFAYLVAGVRAHVAGFGEEVLALAGAGSEPRRTWAAFFAAVTSYNLPGLAIALDDAQLIEGGADGVLAALGYFFDKLPAGVHVLLASRGVPPVPLGRLAARGLVASFDEARLRFSPAEQTAFLAARTAGEIPAAWARRAEGLEGWPLGLALLASGSPCGWGPGAAGDRGSPDAAGGCDADGSLATLVAEELVHVQPEARQAFMRRAALLTDLTPEACRAVFGDTDAAAWLAELEAEHLVRRLAGAVGYQFPPYLREVLLAEAERLLPGPDLARWHHGAAELYLEAGRTEPAIPHLIASRDWRAAIAACRATFPVMAARGRHAPIARWLAAFPRELAAEEPWLELWRGHASAREGRSEEARGYYERARKAFEARGDGTDALKALVRLATLALTVDDGARFNRLMLQATARLEELADEDKADLYLVRALAADRRGDLALMAACNEAVLAIPPGEPGDGSTGNIEVAACHLIATFNLFTLRLHRGELAAARELAERAIGLADAWSFPAFRMAAGFLRAHIELLTGDHEAAAAFVRGLPPYWAQLLEWQDRAMAYVVLGHHHQVGGDHRAAEQALARALALYDDAGLPEGRKLVLERQAWLALARRQYDRAASFTAEAGDLDHGNVYDLALRLPLARMRHLAGDPAGTAQELAALAPALDALGARLLLAKARLFEAAALAKAGEDGAPALAAARAIIRADGFEFLERQDQVLWEELAGCREALQAPATADLKIRLLGGFEVERAGVVLDQWPRRKAKLVLAALALYPRGLTAIDLLEVLGDPAVGAAAMNAMQVNVMALRRVLEPDLGKRAASRYVPLEGEKYVLAPDMLAHTDVTAFERAMAEGDRARSTAPERAAIAYRAALDGYRGDLLAGTPFAGNFEAEREKLRRQALDALIWLAGYAEERGDVTGAAAALRRAGELAPADEDVVLAVMAHHRAHDRLDGVRLAYWDHRRALKLVAGIAPSEDVEGAYKAAVASLEPAAPRR